MESIRRTSRVDDQIEVVVRNISRTPIVLDVFFADDKRDVISSERDELGARETNEERTFTGNPAYVSVIVDESDAEIPRFDSSLCADSQSTVAVVTYDEQSGISVETACQGG